MWMARTFPHVQFERYADDVVVHARTERQARDVLAAIIVRLAECGLDLNEAKTAVVYCRDSNRRGPFDGPTRFDFLGYTFRPRSVKNRNGQLFVSFTPAVSDQAGKRMRSVIRRWWLHRRSTWTLDDLAREINPVTRGWINYYGRFNRSRLTPTLQRIDHYLTRWLTWKYKRFRRHYLRALRFLRAIRQREPNLFAHWKRHQDGLEDPAVRRSAAAFQGRGVRALCRCRAGLLGRPPRKAAARRGRSPPPRTSYAVMNVACRSWWQPLVRGRGPEPVDVRTSADEGVRGPRPRKFVGLLMTSSHSCEHR